MCGETPAPSGVRGRPRDVRCDAALIDATAELLAEVGYDGLTMEAVAVRAGVAKTTLYRRWPSKNRLVADAFEARARAATAVPDSGHLREDLITHLHEVRHRLVGTPGGRAVLGLLGVAGRDPELAQLLRGGFVTVRRAAAARILERSAARGEARADLDVDLVLDLLLAPVYYRLLVSGQPVTDDYLDALVDAVLPSVLVRLSHE